jgi:hypothetical protein
LLGPRRRERSVSVMDFVAVAIALLTFAILIAGIEAIDRV